VQRILRYDWHVRSTVPAAALSSAVLFALAVPNDFFPLGSPLLGLVALVPLYLAYLDAETPGRAALVGVIFGGVSTFLANYWLVFFGEFSVWTIGGTTLGYVLFNAILGPFLWRALRTRRGLRPLLFALVWMSYELLKSVGFLGYPWSLASYPYNTLTVFIQIVDITGVWGVTFVAVYVTAAIAELTRDLSQRVRPAQDSVRTAAAAVALVGVLAGYGVYALSRDVPVKSEINVLLVQQNADAWETSDIAGPLATTQQLTTMGLRDNPEPDLIAWSETSLRYPFDDFRSWYDRNPPDEPFSDFLAGLPAPLLTGSPYRTQGSDFTIHNAALLLDNEGRILEWYGKQQLVPFAEYVPFWESAVVQRFFREVVGIAAIWAPGPGYRLFEVETDAGDLVRIGTPICFEDGFAYVLRRFARAGADVFVNLTNNSWSRRDSAQYQHLVAARFRAVETRRSLIRSTNAGFTGVVDPWGRVTHELPMFVGATLSAVVPVYVPEREPVYVRWGEYLPVAAIAGLTVALFISVLLKKKGSRRATRGGIDEY
jgi:apolipoprotein N-acyltransferase